MGTHDGAPLVSGYQGVPGERHFNCDVPQVHSWDKQPWNAVHRPVIAALSISFAYVSSPH